MGSQLTQFQLQQLHAAFAQTADGGPRFIEDAAGAHDHKFISQKRGQILHPLREEVVFIKGSGNPPRPHGGSQLRQGMRITGDNTAFKDGGRKRVTPVNGKHLFRHARRFNRPRTKIGVDQQSGSGNLFQPGGFDPQAKGGQVIILHSLQQVKHHLPLAVHRKMKQFAPLHSIKRMQVFPNLFRPIAGRHKYQVIAKRETGLPYLRFQKIAIRGKCRVESQLPGQLQVAKHIGSRIPPQLPESMFRHPDGGDPLLLEKKQGFFHGQPGPRRKNLQIAVTHGELHRLGSPGREVVSEAGVRGGSHSQQ